MKALKLEFSKCRGRGLALISLAVLCVMIAWMMWAFRNPDADDQKWGWMLLWYNLPLLRGIIIPTFAAVLASKLSDVEHKSGCLRTLETVQRKSALYGAKFLCGSIFVAAVTVLQLAAMLGIGYAYDFWGQPDVHDVAIGLLFDIVTGMELYSLSLMLSMTVPNQAIPLCVGVGGSFVGLLLMLLPSLAALRLLLPWAHTGALAFIGMDWSKAEGFQGMYRMPVDWTAFAVTCFGTLLAYGIGQRRFQRMEV